MKAIEVTDEQYDFLIRLSKELKTQDNRITADPVFCVYQKILVAKPDGCGTIGWFSDEGSLQTDEDIKESIEEYKYEHPDSLLENDEILEELGYRQRNYEFEDVVVNGQYYLSKNAAQNHINQNSYHYNKPFVFVESAWRNYEWQTIREIILSLREKNEI